MTRHTRYYMWLTGLLCLVATGAATIVVVATSSPVPAHGDPSSVPANPLDTPSAKIASRVATMVEQVAAAPAGTPTSSLSNPLVHVDDDGRIELAFHTASLAVADHEADLARLGGTGIRGRPAGSSSGRPGRVQAWLPHDQLDAAAGLQWVTAISPPTYARLSAGPTGDVVSQGANAHRADLLHAKGIDGTGVKVGVVSDGVTSLAAAQAAGELPANVNVLSPGTGDEGTAMLEIVHDMAPGASLLFAPVGQDGNTFVEALQSLVDVGGANVIVHDVAFDGEPVFESGFVASAIDEITRGGVAVYAAAGNLGDAHVRVPATATGRGPDGLTGPFANCTKQPTNAVALAANGDNTFEMGAFGPPAQSIFVLQWSEPSATTVGHGGFTNLDLYVMDEALTTCLGESDDIQADGVGDTLEAIAPTLPANTPVKVVVNVAGTSSAVAPPIIDLRFRDAVVFPENPPTLASSTNPNNNFTSGLPSAVGAVNAANGQMEPFSGAGPIELFSTTICPDNGDGPCTGVPGGPPQTFQGPAFSAVDNVSVSGAGGFPDPTKTGPQLFQGTSASAPHAAACDALVRDAMGAPTAPVMTVKQRLTAAATDLTAPGPDPVSGAGLLDCLAASRAANLSVSVSSAPDRVAVGSNLTYTINVKNDGPDDSDTFTVIDTLPVGVTYASGPAECVAAQAVSGAAQVVTCSEASLANGQTRTLALVATVGAGVPEGTTSLENQVVVQSDFDPVADQNNSARVSTAFDRPSPAGAGEPILSEPLARTGGEQRNLMNFALGLIAIGGLFVLYATFWPWRRHPALGRFRRVRRPTDSTQL